MKSGNPSPPPPAPVTRVNLLPSRSARLQLYLALQEKISLLPPTQRPKYKSSGAFKSKPNHFLFLRTTCECNDNKAKSQKVRFSKSCPNAHSFVNFKKFSAFACKLVCCTPCVTFLPFPQPWCSLFM
jgi:hypothetical protein